MVTARRRVSKAVAPRATTRKRKQPSPEKTPAQLLLDRVLGSSRGSIVSTIAVIAAIVVAMMYGPAMLEKWKGSIGAKPDDKPTPVVVVDLVEPDARYKTEAEAIAAVLANAKQYDKARDLGACYRGLADVIERDEGRTMTTTERFRTANRIALTTTIARRTYPLEPQVGTSIDALLKTVIGDKPGPIADRSSLVAALRTLGWAFDRASIVPKPSEAN